MQPIQPGIPQAARAPQREDMERVSEQIKGFSALSEVKDHSSSYMKYIEIYRGKGIDLEMEYKKLRESGNKEEIKDAFWKSQEHGPIAQFLEIMPLLANRPGRLGSVMNVKVTKTAKPDDEGNSSVDLIVEITNDFLKTDIAKKDKRFQDMKMSTTFFIDVTSNPEAAVKREGILKSEYLNRGKKANVRCFEKFPGVLGYDAPKVIVLKQADYLANLSMQLRSCVQNVPGRGYMITDEKQFDSIYKVFFTSFLDSARASAEVSVNHFNNLQVPLSQAQKTLKSSYQDVVSFLSNIAICEEENKKTHEVNPA